ncbi:MAG: tRNA preQ1(34) S-adenosylmethionine ribosyltransferase-isomerase QueA [Clostridia bacterium]|nr:tRNA preQ1(34) S-adenosylmethionine ribosyltransferase-isomerase QueA [Clostridia bacterium]
MADLKRSDYYYDLPEELIAQTPAEKRDYSRLMTVDRRTGETGDRHFFDIIDLLNPGDCLVLNNTKVIPARIFGKNTAGREFEALLLRDRGDDVWECLLRPARKAKENEPIFFGGGLTGKVVGVIEDGNRLVKFDYDGIFNEILDRVGTAPLPPYIKSRASDPSRYQTVYARFDGSAAAPTAGLHFTDELLDRIRAKGVDTAFLTLHVGLGTFRPVKEDDLTKHVMHSEWYELPEDAAVKINAAKKRGGRVVSVGTTSCRTLETVASKFGEIRADSGETSIFIYPGYEFKCIDALITNFHLPESTLIMLVSAFSSREIILNAYKEAVEKKYRFFSFGDAMFLY